MSQAQKQSGRLSNEISGLFCILHGSHTELGTLEKFPYGANAGMPVKIMMAGTDKTDQAANVENFAIVLSVSIQPSSIHLISETPETHAHTPHTSSHKFNRPDSDLVDLGLARRGFIFIACKDRP